MGGYGYNQSVPSPLSSSVGGGDHSSGGNPAKIASIGKASYQIGGEMSANAANQAGYEATTAAIHGTAATGASTAAGSAAASGAAGAGTGVVAGGATTSTMAGQGLAALLFYGGESVSQIKSNVNHQVNVIGTDGLKTGEDKIFYKNVHIPRKQV